MPGRLLVRWTALMAGWVVLLMLLMVLQFLMRYLPDLLGKGIPSSLLVELLVYNLAYMLVLAVPMAILLATLLTVVRAAEQRSLQALHSAGVHLMQWFWPVLAWVFVLSIGMGYFNHEILPRANQRTLDRWNDIRFIRPLLTIRPGVFMSDLGTFSLRVDRLSASGDTLYGMVMVDYSEGNDRPVFWRAARGGLYTAPDGSVQAVLEQGELHRIGQAGGYGRPERYELLAFDRYAFQLTDASGQLIGSGRSQQSDRTMTRREINGVMDGLERQIDSLSREAVRAATALRDSFGTATLAALRDTAEASDVQRFLRLENKVSQANRGITWRTQRLGRYQVEMYKKTAIAVAGALFVLFGLPLGYHLRRYGIGGAMAAAVGIFILYWALLVQGEKLADRGLLVPWLGMWMANILLIPATLWAWWRYVRPKH